MNPPAQPADPVIAATMAAPATAIDTNARQALPVLAAPVAIATPDNAPATALPRLAAQAGQAADDGAALRIRTVLQRAFALLGTPYRWGGASPDSGFDCSGLVGYLFRTIGIDLPRVSRAMAHEGIAVADRSALAEGDLVFFGRRGRVDHVGIYIGGGKFLHAPRTGRDVTVSSLEDGYWSHKFLQARRLAGV